MGLLACSRSENTRKTPKITIKAIKWSKVYKKLLQDVTCSFITHTHTHTHSHTNTHTHSLTHSHTHNTQTDTQAHTQQTYAHTHTHNHVCLEVKGGRSHGHGLKVMRSGVEGQISYNGVHKSAASHLHTMDLCL